MLNVTKILIQAAIRRLKKGYRRTFGRLNPEYEDIIGWAGGMALENIANSDALYHNVEHSVLVTLVGQEILRGKHIHESGITSKDWLHFMISLVCHDIGYVKGVCLADQEDKFATGRGDEMITLPPGSTDAALTPFHVDRGKMFVDERFRNTKLIDPERIKSNIEHTRFPIPNSDDPAAAVDFPGLVRAADLIGQMSDFRYLKKIAALYYEFEETGTNRKLGYNSPGDLRKNYPRFYWMSVFPYIKDALHFLALTQQGKSITALLYSNVFVVEHENAVSLLTPVS
jgi:hypothetical protein